MTAIHPHQLRPNPDLKLRAAAALLRVSGIPKAVVLVGVRSIVRYLRPALGLPIHRELVLGWIAAGMPATKITRRGQGHGPIVWATNSELTLRWLAENGSSPRPRRALLSRSRPRVSRSGNRGSTGRGTSTHRTNNPTRGKKPKKGKAKRRPVHEL